MDQVERKIYHLQNCFKKRLLISGKQEKNPCLINGMRKNKTPTLC